MIRVEGLDFYYMIGENILEDISFTAEKGEIIGILGANGVGKTTLLKLLAGLLTPRSGNVQINDKSAVASCGDIAFISEAGSYLKDLSPKEYGEFLSDFYPDFDMAYYEKLLRFFQLEDKPIKKMSKGQKAKAEVAAGMVKKTKYIKCLC